VLTLDGLQIAAHTDNAPAMSPECIEVNADTTTLELKEIKFDFLNDVPNGKHLQ
jgi:hypothetical protein